MSDDQSIKPGVLFPAKLMVAPFLILFLVVLVACGGSAEQVRMGTEGAYPPYNFVNDAGELDGFELDLGNELCSRAGLECIWVTNEWDTIIPNLLADKYDTIIAGMTIDEERGEVIDFTHAYFPPTPSVYLALAGAGDDAVNGTVAVQTATVQADYLVETGATLLELELAEDVIMAVETGQADAALADRDFLAPYVADSGGSLTFVGPEVALGYGIGIGVREGDTQLKDRFNRAIDEMIKDGSLNDLIIKWFGDDAPTF